MVAGDCHASQTMRSFCDAPIHYARSVDVVGDRFRDSLVSFFAFPQGLLYTLTLGNIADGRHPLVLTTVHNLLGEYFEHESCAVWPQSRSLKATLFI